MGTAHRPLAVLLIAAGAASIACRGNQNVFNPAGPAARDIASLGLFLMGVCAVIYAVVLAALGWALVRRRRASDDRPETERRLTVTVAAAVAVTTLILVLFTTASVWAGRGLTTPAAPGAITIDVIGHQWWWEFQYRDGQPAHQVTVPNELHLPVGVPVELVAQSRDVIHSFWVPNLHGKRDLIPGQTTRFWIQADAAGTWRGQCAEFCGYQHANMAFIAVAEPRAEFDAWLGRQRAPAGEPAAPAEARGRDVFLRSSCMMCHTVRGTAAGARTGPDLTHVGSRLTVAAGTLPNTADHLAAWVRDPQASKPGTRMPPTILPPADLDDLLAYLRALR